jgi:predicted phosphodiesterase
MRFAAISDIHGNLTALKAVLAEIERLRIEHLVNLGDLLSGPLRPAETADMLMALGCITIRGNHERQLLQQPVQRMGASDAFAAVQLRPEHRRWIEGLPAELWLRPDVLLCHGSPRSDLEYFLEDIDADGRVVAAPPQAVAQRRGASFAALTLCGHTHIPRVLRLEDGRLIVNPGSVGLQAYDDTQPRFHRVEVGDPCARFAVLSDEDDGAWSASLCQVAYDHEEEARRAERNGRADWAWALRTGRTHSP